MQGADMHWLFAKLPFVTMHNVEGYELHLFHLGLSMGLAGSVLWLLCYEALPGDPATNVGQVWEHIGVSYRRHGVATTFGNLTLSSFTDPKNPKSDFHALKGKGRR